MEEDGEEDEAEDHYQKVGDEGVIPKLFPGSLKPDWPKAFEDEGKEDEDYDCKIHLLALLILFFDEYVESTVVKDWHFCRQKLGVFLI